MKKQLCYWTSSKKRKNRIKKTERENKMKKYVLILLMALTALPVYGQKHIEKQLKGYSNPEELVTLSETIAFDKAVMILSQVSENLTGKKILSTANFTDPIGIAIDKMPYMRALTTIVKYNNLEYSHSPTSIIVQNKKELEPGGGKDLKPGEYASINEREVRISTVFFELNVSELRERGFNWDWSLSTDGIKIGSELLSFGELSEEQQSSSASGSQQMERSPEFKLNTQSEFTMGEFSGEANATIKFFEDNNFGEIIAHPSITVKDGSEGFIQIGTDISIKQQDFSGNITDKFISTGTIVKVTPRVFNEDEIDYVFLNLDVERSSGQPGAISTQINKTKAQSEVLMLNGEETVIGGLYLTEESSETRGVPLLKDLPWWVFGLKYLFGYESVNILKREVVILIKAEIIPSIKERIANKKEELLIQKQHEFNEENIKKYSIKNQDNED
ncbi:MAG: type II and III secretion system protein [Melioribacteraceae bacterium]|nr:type II and III secretion system protein [Melioribacteraceae bacterium]